MSGGTSAPVELRARLGWLCAAFGLLHLLPLALVALSAGGPAPLALSPRTWSLFFFGHFAALVACGLGLQLWSAVRTKLFHGGPLIDFLLGVAGFMLLESAAAEVLRGGGSLAWGLLPGAALIAFGLRLANGGALLKE